MAVACSYPLSWSEGSDLRDPYSLRVTWAGWRVPEIAESATRRGIYSSDVGTQDVQAQRSVEDNIGPTAQGEQYARCRNRAEFRKSNAAKDRVWRTDVVAYQSCRATRYAGCPNRGRLGKAAHCGLPCFSMSESLNSKFERLRYFAGLLRPYRGQ